MNPVRAELSVAGREGTRVRALLTIMLIVLLPLLSSGATTVSQPWRDPGQSPDRRADELLAQMTLDEKIQLLHGTDQPGYAGYVPPIPRLGVPALGLTDGPAGVRQGKATALPAPVSMAAGWSPGTARGYGDVLGAETVDAGRNVLLAPTVNIARVPQNGRNFEGLGEDPALAGALAAPELQALQGNGVIGTVKHYAANNQETDRETVNAVVDQRVLQEIYLPAFRSAVQQGGSGSVMCAYNRVNGPHACENDPLLTGALRDQWKFPGFVMSDWGATHSTVASARAGLDMEMPNGQYFGPALRSAVLGGEVSMATIDAQVHRVLRTMFAVGLFDRPVRALPAEDRAAVAQQVAEEGTVLLKNQGGLLPLAAANRPSIAVIGADANTSVTAGGGSSRVTPAAADTLLGAVRDRAPGATVRFAAGTDPVGPGSNLPGLQQVPSGVLTPSGQPGGHGLTGTYYPNRNFTGPPDLVRTDPGVNADWNWYAQDQFSATSAPGIPPSPGDLSARWTGSFTAPSTGDYTFDLTSGGAGALYWDGRTLINNDGSRSMATRTATVHLAAGQRHDVRIDFASGYPGQIRFGWRPPADAVDRTTEQAVDLARQSDVAVVVARDYESEALDRPSLDLPNHQDALISRVAAVNPHTVVVLETGGPVLMPWLDRVPAVLEAWYPGERGGAAVASVLFGDTDPAGRLPVTFPRDPSQLPANTPARFPGVNLNAAYSEGLDVGYRHYDAHGLMPLFPFGYGLSYTTFTHRLLGIQSDGTGNVAADVSVTNTGGRPGSDVVQAYVGDPAATGEPPQQLKAFGKVALQPGQQTVVRLRLDPHAFAHWEPAGWVITPGAYQIMIGSSGRDLPERSTVDLGARHLGP
jgi:beta-glucosidase